MSCFSSIFTRLKQISENGIDGLAGNILLLAALLVSVLVSVTYGSVDISTGNVYNIIVKHLAAFARNSLQSADMTTGFDVIVWQIRLPRVLTAGMAGGILAVGGIFMQTLTQNPIADPYILGISSGASTGAVCAIIFGFPRAFIPVYPVQVSAFLGALAALSIVLILAGRNPSPLRLVLLGMGISSFFMALTTFVLQKAQNDSQLRSAMFWMLGSFSAADWPDLPLVFFLLCAAVAIAFVFEKELDALLLGDISARSLGIPVLRIKTTVSLWCTLIIAILVSKTGVVGFVGLLVPHVARKMRGARHRPLIPFAALSGAIFMIWADTAARTLFSPEEIPVGILTAMIGAPVFVWVVQRGYKFGGQE
jgi:iron complex transport system permease protein